MVIIQSENAFDILCAQCGKAAAHIEQATGDNSPALRYRSLATTRHFNSPRAEALLPLLHAGDIAALHDYLFQHVSPLYSGMDVYCPTCRAAYCADHWDLQFLYADDYPGWMESIIGYCPKGHRRTLD